MLEKTFTTKRTIRKFNFTIRRNHLGVTILCKLPLQDISSSTYEKPLELKNMKDKGDFLLKKIIETMECFS